MASLKASSWLFSRHLKRDAFSVEGLSRTLSSFTLSLRNSSEAVSIVSVQQERSLEFSDLSYRRGNKEHARSCCGTRKFNTSATESQTQLETELSTPESPAAGYRAASSPLRSYSPVVSGFSVLSHPAADLPAGLGLYSNVRGLSLELLGREMSNRLSLGKLEETIQLFEDWIKFPDLDGKSKVLNLMIYNLLLHAKLRIGADPLNLLQIVNEMEMSGVKPNLLSYNFLLRALFRQRNALMAEKILHKMEQSGPEAQPDGDSYNFVIVLCALDRKFDSAMKHLQSMYSRGYVPSKTTYNELLLGATRALRTRAAVSLLKDMKKHNIVPQLQNLADLTTAATEVDDSECVRLALRVLTETEQLKAVRNQCMDEGGIHAILGCSARTADIDLSTEAWSLLLSSLRGTRPPLPSSYHARIHALSAAGDFDAAFSTVHEMEEAYSGPQNSDTEIFSPASSLRPLVLACTRGGAAGLDAVYYKLAEIHTGGKPVALASINCVIQGCSNIWDCDRAYQTFETIGTTFSLMPDVHSCNALLDVFGKNRKMAEVLQIYNYMHEMAIKPDFRTYSLLIDAHVVNRDVKAATDALDAMVTAGHIPPRESAQKIRRRCIRDGDEEGVRQIDGWNMKFGYRDNKGSVNRWLQLREL